MSTFNQIARSLKTSAENVAQTLKTLDKKQTDDSSVFETDLLNATMEAELVCRNLRKLLIQTGIITRHSLFAQLCSIHNTYVEEKNGEIHIIMPPLPLKKKAHKNCAFLMDPLAFCLDEYTHNHTCMKYAKARITICHCYPKGTPTRRIRDCDNIEVKKLLDLLALYFLKDDNMACCEILQTSRPDEEYKTEITITDWVDNQ